MVVINEEYDYQKQIDRACSAQSPEMLPQSKVDKNKLDEARERVKQQKSQYKVPASSWRFDQTL